MSLTVEQITRIENGIKERAEQQKQLKLSISKIRSYVDNVLSKNEKYIGKEIGVVYTKIEIDITEYNRFMIYVSSSNGLYVNHEFLSLDDHIEAITTHRKALEEFCESKGITDIEYISKDKARSYFKGYHAELNQTINIMYAYYQYGTVWFNGVISGMVR